MVAFTTSKPLPLTEPTPTPSQGPRMRLVGTEEWQESTSVPPATDRRCYPRKSLSLRVQGKRLDHSVDARREPFLNLQMKDVSVGGLAALSQTALRPGERVAVFFPPEGNARGWDAYGRVLRVAPAAVGYDVALEFDGRPAA